MEKNHDTNHSEMDHEFLGNIVLLAIVTLISVIQNVFFASKVENESKNLHSKSFQRTGSPSFEKVYTANQNCIDAYPTFLAVLWCAGIFCSQGPAAFSGIMYLFVRQKYFVGYLGEKTQRTITITSQEEYEDVKQKLYNRVLILIVSACETDEYEMRKYAKPTNLVKNYILLVNGIYFQKELAELLNSCHNHSSTCVNFRLKIDFRDPLRTWTYSHGFKISRGVEEIIPSWENTRIFINYRADSGCNLWYFWGLKNMKCAVQGYPVAFLNNHNPHEQEEVRQIFEVFNKTEELEM